MTAGTIMHRSHLPLKTWFTAIHMVTSHSNGISALQLQAQLGLGSYKSAWLLLHKLRRAMVDPGRSLLEALVEIDEASLPQRTAQDPPTAGQGRSAQGKMLIAGAVELSPEGEPRRIRDCESIATSVERDDDRARIWYLRRQSKRPDEGSLSWPRGATRRCAPAAR